VFRGDRNRDDVGVGLNAVTNSLAQLLPDGSCHIDDDDDDVRQDINISTTTDIHRVLRVGIQRNLPDRTGPSLFGVVVT
jgi:hypothetical protein